MEDNMRIAVSGTHFAGKSTLINDFIKNHPKYKHEIEPYYKLQDEKAMELSLAPTLDSLIEQLECSIELINQNINEQNIIFDRCPIDFIAYAMCELDQDEADINENEISEKFPQIKDALNNLDLIVFLPITKEHAIEYTDENPTYRQMVDKCFKKIYRDDLLDIFPRYNHPRIIEVWGDRLTRVKMLESYL
jgi:hypothetical protein